MAVSVVDKADDYRTLCIKGTAELIDEGADAHIDKLAKKYLDADTLPFPEARRGAGHRADHSYRTPQGELTTAHLVPGVPHASARSSNDRRRSAGS